MTDRAHQVSINIERRIGGLTLLAVWFAVFVLPVAILQLSLDYLFNLIRQANLRAVSAKMTNEMDSFRNDLETESYLQRECQKFFVRPSLSPETDANSLAVHLQSLAGIKAVGVIAHSADTQDVDYWFNDELSQSMANLSRIFMRRWFVSVNEQQRHSFHNAAAMESTRALFRFASPEKSKQDSDLFFRRMFSLISEVPVVPDRVSRTVSAKTGGSIYFYYHPVKVIQGDLKRIKAGWLLIMRGRDIVWSQVARSAARRGGQGMQRGFSRFSESLYEQQMTLQKPITRFVEDARGYHLLSTMSPGSMVDLIHGGTFTPVRLREFAESMPLLQITVAESLLQHPLFPYRSHISFACRLFVLAGTLLLMNLYLFGFEFKAGITGKVIGGTAFIMVLPFLLLVSGFVSWNQVNQVIGRYQLESRQQHLFTSFTEGFATFMIDLQRATYDLASEMENRLESGNDDEIRSLLTRHLSQKRVVAELRLDRKFADDIYVNSPFFPDRKTRAEESTMQLFAATIMHGFNEEGVLTNVSSTGEEEDFSSMNASFINEVFNRCGGIYQFAVFGRDRRFSSVYFNYPGKNSIRAILTAVFECDTLLREFIGTHFRGEAGLRYQFFLKRDDSGLTRFFNLVDNTEVEDRQLLEHLKLASISGHHLYEPKENQLIQIFSMTDMSLFMLTQGSMNVGQQITTANMLLMPLYGLVLMLLILLVFKLIYLRPIEEFIRVTECVAVGDYRQQVELVGADEFGELKTAFDEMIAGLEQRRRLSHFLSSEALRAVESDSEESMAVGGERIEATVAFVQLAMLQHLKSEASPEEIFAALGDFIAAADIAASQHGGVVDKLVEDTLMLVFRADPTRPDHALAASAAVLDLERQMRARDLRICAGIASGQVVSGRIGSRLGKLDLTVIGDPVNLAARLRAQAKKAANTGIIIAPGAIRILKGRARITFIERTELKGKSREYPLYELVALRSKNGALM